MKMASGIITNRGGRTCHAAIVARELGIAAVVGTDNALGKCKDGSIVTVSCCEGDIGKKVIAIVTFGSCDLAL
jgi:pyruvate, water dikinase